jgi:predicted RNA binding protein YcfA (HicA-like mRNA interferase family)
MPSATAREFQRVANLLGFILTRQKGSHARWNHPDGRGVTIPVHGGEEIGPPLFYTILKQMGISWSSFRSCASFFQPYHELSWREDSLLHSVS